MVSTMDYKNEVNLACFPCELKGTCCLNKKKGTPGIKFERQVHAAHLYLYHRPFVLWGSCFVLGELGTLKVAPTAPQAVFASNIWKVLFMLYLNPFPTLTSVFNASFSFKM